MITYHGCDPMKNTASPTPLRKIILTFEVPATDEMIHWQPEYPTRFQHIQSNVTEIGIMLAEVWTGNLQNIMGVGIELRELSSAAAYAHTLDLVTLTPGTRLSVLIRGIGPWTNFEQRLAPWRVIERQYGEIGPPVSDRILCKKGMGSPFRIRFIGVQAIPKAR
jgi:hypothetical protein